MANKFRYDVLNAHVVPCTINDDGTATYDTTKITRAPGLISLDLSAEGDETVIRADGINYIVDNSNNGYSGDINFVLLADNVKQLILPEVLDEATGIQYEDAEAEPKHFALLGEFKGDSEHIRFALYNCVASRPNLQGENKDTPKDPSTDTLPIRVSPVYCTVGGESKSIVKGGVTPTAKKATYDAWFEDVQLPTGNA